MNDIEVLEELLKKKKCDIGYYMVYIFDDREKQAIENLLKERQSDKERIKDLEEINEAHKKENGELRERVKELEKENENEFKRGFFTKVAENKANTLKIESQVIPKSLIKEKIKEYKAKTDCRYCNNSCNSYAVCKVLEKLLKGE